MSVPNDSAESANTLALGFDALELETLEFEEERQSLAREAAGTDFDPFFTARVLEALPAPLRFTGLSPRARATLMVAVHAVGVGLAYVLLSNWEPAPAPVPVWLGSTADAAHDLLGPVGDEPSMMVGIVAVAVVACVAFVTTRSHTRST